MTLELEVGKRYIRRDGSATGPLVLATAEDRWSATHPYSDGIFSYAASGKFGVDRFEHLLDLVAEYVEPIGAIHDAMLTADKARPAAPNSKKAVLEAAIATVADRGVPYGGVEDNFARIAALWNAHISNRYTARPTLDPSDVAMMMALMKIARLANSPTHMDSWIDIAGYAACGGEIAAKGA